MSALTLNRMLWATALLTLSACATEPEASAWAEPGQRQSAITFSQQVQPGEMPAVGSVVNLNGRSVETLCTGTLIAPDVVITAAHCLPQRAGDAAYFNRELAAPLLGSPGRPLTSAAAATLLHPDYEPNPNGRLRTDIGLMFLDTPLEGVPPMAVADEGVLPWLVVGAPVVIAGYGRNEMNLSGRLHKARTTLSHVDALEIRAGGHDPEPSKCSGDSGGPTILLAEDGREPLARVAAVNSFGVLRAEGDCSGASVETRVDVHLGWILRSMEAACADGTRPASVCEADPWPRLASFSTEPEAPEDPPPAPMVNGVEPGETVTLDPVRSGTETEGGCSARPGHLSGPMPWLLLLVLLYPARRKVRQ